MTRPIFRAALAAVLALAAPSLHAQQDTTRGVRLGLTYLPGVKPGVVVLPIAGPTGDTIQAILQRDFDYGDRISVIEGNVVTATAAAQGSGAVTYGVWKALGAAALVQVQQQPGGVHVAVHDVVQGKVAQARDFSFTGMPGAEDWRLSVHVLADELERWITGVRGIAATRILYVRDGRVYVIDSDGYGDHPVTPPGGLSLAPAWSPDGQRIAYSTLERSGWNVMVRNLASGATHVVRTTPGGLNTTPVFSPDGQWLCYAHGGEHGTDLYMIAASLGGSARQVTVGRGSDNVSPTFSPDGQRIAFTSGRAGHPEVYTADFDGSNVELLTPYNFGDQNYRSNPNWSPDGRTVAFQSQINGVFQVMVITLRDRSVRQLTSEGGNEDPSWAPDGRHLVFTSTRTGVKQLFVLDAESGRTRQLTHSAGARLDAWSGYLGHAP